MKAPAVVEYVDIRKLKPAVRNPKRHDIPGIASSIRRFGFAEVLIENAKTKRLVAGHGRLEALQLLHSQDPKNPPKMIQLGAGNRWLAPVLRGVSFENDQEAEGYLIGDNRHVEAGGWNKDDLAAVLKDLHAHGGVEAIAVAGWSMPEFEKFSAPAPAGNRPPAPGDIAGSNSIRQMMFAYKGTEFGAILSRMQNVMNKTGVDNHTEALIKLLESYENHPS